MARTRRNRLKVPKRELPRLPSLPSLPRLTINWNAAFAVLSLAAIALVSFALGRELLDLPVRTLDIEGRFQRVTKLEILAAAQPALKESFLTLDLEDIRERVAAIDWVDTVKLQRVWPDTLRISYEEHRAAARWGDSGLLNTRGELFADDVRREYPELPRLAGPEGSHHRVAATYMAVRDRLARANLTLESIEMDARGSFSIGLAGGMTVRIGRDDLDRRIDRLFAVAVPTLAGEIDRVAYIDLRYANGFAVGWREAPASDSTLARLSGG
jgi:cell division protein FtsQ